MSCSDPLSDHEAPPTVSPTAAEEEYEVEEIIRDEPRTQSVRILRKRGDEVVVVEEDTPREMRRLKSALGGVVKQIEVDTESRKFIVVIVCFLLSLSLCISRG